MLVKTINWGLLYISVLIDYWLIDWLGYIDEDPTQLWLLQVTWDKLYWLAEEVEMLVTATQGTWLFHNYSDLKQEICQPMLLTSCRKFDITFLSQQGGRHGVQEILYILHAGWIHVKVL